MAGPLDEIKQNRIKRTQEATKKLLTIRVEGYGESFQKSLELGKALKDPMTYARMIPGVGAYQAVTGDATPFGHIGKIFTPLNAAMMDWRSQSVPMASHIASPNPIPMSGAGIGSLAELLVKDKKTLTRHDLKSYPLTGGAGRISNIPRVTRATQAIPGQGLRTGVVQEPLGEPPPEVEHPRLGVYNYDSKKIKKEFEENDYFYNKIQTETRKINARQDLNPYQRFVETAKMKNTLYDELPESEKLFLEFTSPPGVLKDWLIGKGVGKIAKVAWPVVKKAPVIDKLISKWKTPKGETIYSHESPGPGAVEERLESIHDIAILKSPQIRTEIPQVIQPGQERLAEFRKTIPEKVDVSPEAMNNWRAEVGDKYGISADTARVKMKEAGGIIAEEIPEQKIFNDWATEFTTIQRIHNKDFKEKAIGISFPWSNKWKVIQARALDKPFMTHTLEDIEDGYVVLMHGAKEEYDEFGRMHILTSGEGRIGAGVYTGNHPFIARQYAGLFTDRKYSPKSNVRMFGVDPMPRNSIFDLNGEIIPGSRNYKAIDLLKKNMQEGTDGVSAQHWTEAVNEVLMEGPAGQGWTAGRITLSKNTLQETDTIWFAFDNLDDFANNNPIWVQLPPEWLFDDMWDTAVKLGHVDATTPKVYPMMLDDVRGTFGGWNPLRPLQGWDVRDTLLPEIKRNLEAKGYIFKPYLLEQYKGQDEIPVPKGPWGEQADELNEMMATPPPANEIPELVPAKEPGIIGKPRWQDPKEVLQPSPDSEIFEAERGGLGYVAQYMGEDSMWSNDFLRASGYQAIHHFQRVDDVAHPIAYQEGARNLPYVHNVLARGLKEKGQLIEHALYAFSRKMAIDDLHPKGTVPEKYIEQVQMAYARGDYDDVWLLDIPKKYLKEDRPLEHLRLLFEDNPNLIPRRPNNKVPDIQFKLQSPGTSMQPRTGHGLEGALLNIEDDMNKGLWKSDILDEGLFPDEMYTDVDSGRVIMFIGKLFDDEGNILAFAQDPKSFGFSYLNKAIARTQEELIEAHFKALPETLDLIQARELASKRAINIDPIGVDKKTTQLGPKVDLSKGVPLDTLPPPGRTIPPAAIAVGAGAGVGTGLGAGVHALSQREKPIPPPQPISPIPPVETLGDPEFVPETDPTRIQEAGLPWGQIGKGIGKIGKEVVKKVWDPSEFVTKIQKIGKPDGWGEAIDNMLAKQADVEKEGLVAAEAGTKGEFIPRMPWVGKLIDWMPNRLIPKSLRESEYIREAPKSNQQEVSTLVRFLASDDPIYGNIVKAPDGRPGWQVFREDVQRAGFRDVDELQEVMIDAHKTIDDMQITRAKEVEDIRAEFTPQLQDVGIDVAKRAREGKLKPDQKATEITEELRQTARRAGYEYSAPVMERDLGQVIDEVAKRKGISHRVNAGTVREFLLGDLYIHLNEHNSALYRLYSQNINPGYIIPNAFGDTIKGPWDLLNYQLNVNSMFDTDNPLLPGRYTLGLLTEILGPTVTEPLRLARIRVQKGWIRQWASDLAPGPVRNAYFELIEHFEKAEVGKGPWQTAAARANQLIIDPSKKGWTDLTRYSMWDYLTDTAGAWKTTESSFDNSIPFIQGYPLLMESPKVWFNAWKVSARAWLPGGGGRVDKTLDAIMAHPLYNVSVRAGLVIPKRGSGQEIEQAQLMNTFIGRTMRKLWPSAAQAENAAIGFLSSGRFNYFVREYEKMIALKKAMGQPESLTKDEMDAIVQWAHLITGRGPLGEFLDKKTAEGGWKAIQAIMNATVFSARKNSADFLYAPVMLKKMAEGRSTRMGIDNTAEAHANMFTRVLAQQRSRAAIIMFYRGLAILKTIGFLGGLREMLDMTKGDDELLDWFEDNLHASFKPGSTFLKFRIGKTWDSPFASQAQVASFMYELLFGERWTSTGVKTQIGLGQSLLKFGRNKLSPLASAILGYSTGRGYGGEWFEFKEDLSKTPALDERSSFWYRHLTSISLDSLVEIWDNYIVQPSIPDQIKKRLGIPTDKPTPVTTKEMLETQPDQKILGLIAGIAGFHGRGSTWMAPEEEVARALDMDIEDVPTSVMAKGKKAVRDIERERTGVIRDSDFERLRDERDQSIQDIKYIPITWSETGEEKFVIEWAEDFKTTEDIPYELKKKISDLLFNISTEHRIKTQALLEKPGRITDRDTDIERQRAGMDTKNRLLSQWWQQASRAQDMNSYSERFTSYINGIENSRELTEAEKKEATQHIYASAYPYDIPSWLLKFLPPTTQNKIVESRDAASWALDYYKKTGSTKKVDNNR